MRMPSNSLGVYSDKESEVDSQRFKYSIKATGTSLRDHSRIGLG